MKFSVICVSQSTGEEFSRFAPCETEQFVPSRTCWHFGGSGADPAPAGERPALGSTLGVN